MPSANSSHPIANGLRELSSILEREKSRGHEFVDLSPEATDALQSLPVEFTQRAMETPASTNSETTDAGVETTVAAPASVPAAAGTSVVALVDGERTEEWAREQLNKIFLEVKNCEACRALGTLRETIVFATGNPLADVMFIGEAPGAEEEKQKKPFVGPAGQKLMQIIGAMGLSRDDVYISNIVKFRPKKGDGRFQGSSNRKPDQAEMASCISFIRAEIEVVQPKVIVALGGTAAEGLLERGGTISALREQLHEFAGVPVVVTYHPSFLLRQESEPDQEKAKAMKRRVWEDMLRAMDLLGMPVSEKQRGFFL
jgi:DNA polymerase